MTAARISPTEENPVSTTTETSTDPLDRVATRVHLAAQRNPGDVGRAHERIVYLGDAKRIRDEAHSIAFAAGQVHGYETAQAEGLELIAAERAKTIEALAARMRADSEHWFPALHAGEASEVPLFMHYALGLIGEAGEVANVVKKLNRDGYTDDRMADLGAELADVLIYLLLLAGETGIDIVEAYRAKRERNVERWGMPV